MAYQYSSQMGLLATFCDYLLYLLGNLSLNGCCRCFSVNQLHLYFFCLKLRHATLHGFHGIGHLRHL